MRTQSCYRKKICTWFSGSPCHQTLDAISTTQLLTPGSRSPVLCAKFSQGFYQLNPCNNALWIWWIFVEYIIHEFGVIDCRHISWLHTIDIRDGCSNNACRDPFWDDNDSVPLRLTLCMLIVDFVLSDCSPCASLEAWWSNSSLVISICITTRSL